MFLNIVSSPAVIPSDVRKRSALERLGVLERSKSKPRQEPSTKRVALGEGAVPKKMSQSVAAAAEKAEQKYAEVKSRENTSASSKPMPQRSIDSRPRAPSTGFRSTDNDDDDDTGRYDRQSRKQLVSEGEGKRKFKQDRTAPKRLEDLPTVAVKQATKLSVEETKEVGKHADKILSAEKADFASLGLLPDIANHLATEQLTRPTSIQAESIPQLLLTSRDALIKSETGSGKTLAYLLPILHHCVDSGRTGVGDRLKRKDGTRALVLAPTRELVLQIESVWKTIAKPFYWLICSTVMGGENKQKEKARLRKGVHVVLGTPGRVLDHMETTSSWILSEIQWFIMDEADRLLDLGFDKSIRAIFKTISVVQAKDAVGWRERRRNILVSATLSKSSGVGELASVVLRNPLRFGFSGHDDESMDSGDKTKKDVPERSESESESENEDDKQAESSGSESESESGSESESESQSESEAHPIETNEAEGGTSNSSSENEDNSSDENSESDEDDESDEESQTEQKSSAGTKRKVIAAAKLEGEEFALPTTLEHLYVPLASRHRLVALAAFLRLQLYLGRGKRLKSASSAEKPSTTSGVKIIVFLSTCPAVEFIHTLFSHTLWPGVPEYEQPLIETELWKLHGNMPQRLRTQTYYDFCAASEGILICTDVAARGLDLPSVNWVVQFDAPESVEDYIHRAGRTARIGHDGNVITFLVQSELAFLDVLKRSAIKLTEVPLPRILGGLHIGFDRPIAEILARADPSNQLPAGAVLQKRLEGLVEANDDLIALAKNAYTSFIRAYAAYPKALKSIFHPRLLHLGEVAHSFALKERPTAMGAQAALMHDRAADLIDRINKAKLPQRPSKTASITATPSPSGPGAAMSRAERRAKYRPQTASQDPKKARVSKESKPKPKVNLKQIARTSEKKGDISEFM